MNRTPWINRTFYFEIPPGWIFNVLERLRGTGIRLRTLTAGVNDADASLRDNDKWSIKEHIGHLADLEELHIGRISDFVFREPVLRAADMTNEKTNRSQHNSKSISTLIDDFEASRNKLILLFEQLDNETQQFASMHPRLQKPMRPVDMAFFTAEHDDHHLASIRLMIASGF